MLLENQFNLTGTLQLEGAEISAYDKVSKRVFVTGESAGKPILQVVDLNNPDLPTKITNIDLSSLGAGVQSVAVKNGIVATAISASLKTDPGKVAFFDGTTLNQLGEVTVGALPDMLTFTPDGKQIVVANEGEPDGNIDPQGSISIIDLSQGITNATVKTVDFKAFNGKEEELRARGVRIFADKNVATDLEPEYIAVSDDSKTAFVTLQENNAIAVIDLANTKVTEIQPLGFKDWSKGQPQLSQYTWDLSSQVLGTTPAGQQILLGGMSGLFFEKVDETGKLYFIATPDRGPNGEPTDVDGDGVRERPFILPDYQPRLVRFTIDRAVNKIEIIEQIFLTRDSNGQKIPLTGKPNLQAKTPGSAYTDEEPVDLNGLAIANDPFGADFESIAIAPDGTYWLSDEYRPAIYHFDRQGNLIDRFIPEGTSQAAGGGDFGKETLPPIYAQRRENRGFEGMTFNTDNGKLYAWIQSPLDNPDVGNDSSSRRSQVLRILEVDPANGQATGEYLYLLEGSAGVDKIGDIAYKGGGKFLAIERDSGTTNTSKKFIFEIDLTGATNIIDNPLAQATDATNALEGKTADGLIALGIRPVNKIKVLNLPSLGYLAGDKAEGLTILPNGDLVVINDNDFGLLPQEIAKDGSAPLNPNPTPTILGIIEFERSNQIDPSDSDGGANFQNPPIFGLYMPDGIATFTTAGQTYYIIANEGDSRGEERRVKELNLDPLAFPNANDLKLDNNLGRLNVSSIDGDLDLDGDYDRIFTYGGRSFSIFDSQGNLVFDSGDLLEKLTLQFAPDLFNANNGDKTLKDTRSDDKGPEPEGLTVGKIGDRTLAFIGLERTSGTIVFDITNPSNPTFLEYLTKTEDISPEGVSFINPQDSPNGKPLLLVSNELSNTLSIMEKVNFRLQLLHASDQEAGIPALEDAPRFSAVLNALKNQDGDGNGQADYPNTLLLSSGDAYIPSLFLDSSKDSSLATLLGKEGQGRGDIIIQNELGFQAIAFGNHEFDFGTSLIKSLLLPDGNYPGAKFPYLSSNLDFTKDNNLKDLVTADGQEANTIPNKIAKSTVITINGEKIGVVGATTPTLGRISSPGTVGIVPSDANDIPALAAEIQKSVDALTATGINKIVLLAHMQQISIEQQLATQLKNVDIIMAGGSNTRLIDSTDPLRAGDTKEGDYPIFTKSALGEDIVIINTDGNYKYVGRLVVDFDNEGKIIPTSIDPNISGAYATDDRGVAALNAQNLVDPEIQAITNALSEVIIKQDSNVVGLTDVFLNGTRSDVRTQETNLGNLTADANLFYAKNLDPSVVVSIKNGGGIRNNIGRVFTPTGSLETVKLPPEGNELSGKPDGGISQPDLQNALSFNNALTLVSLTAEQLKQILEHGVAASASGATPGQFPQVGGISFSFDLAQPAGSRIKSAVILNDDDTFRDVLVKDGQLQGNKDRLLRLVTLGFLADGGDNYPFASFIAANPQLANRIDLIGETNTDLNLNGAIEPAVDPTKFDLGKSSFAASGTEQDAFAEYLQANFSLSPFDLADVAPAEDTRIQRLNARQDSIFGQTTITESETKGFIDLEGNSLSEQLRFSISSIPSLNRVDELVVFETEDPNGAIDLKQLLVTDRAKVIAAAITNLPNGFSNNVPRTLGFNRDRQLGFALIKNGTADDIIAGKNQEIVFSNSDEFNFNFGQSNLEFEIGGLKIQAETVNEPRPLGTKLQSGNEGELLDLRDIADRVSVTFSLFREAAFNNQVYFYRVDNGDGIVNNLDPDTAGKTDYRNVVVNNLVRDITGQLIKLEVGNGANNQVNAVIDDGGILVPLIVVNGTLEQLQDTNTSNDPEVYFPFLGANSDGVDHLRLLGDNTFGFEDLVNGGDADYNDAIIRITLG
jgi:2',3'-cyclic-nucleotide 2'-phosphodiesterase (5'-nucleotidase family)